MTRKEINSQINKVPAERRLHLGIELLEELPDSCVILTHNRIEYRSYPEIPGILVGSKFVTWETGSEDVCEVDVKNPEHMEEIIRRGSRLQFDNIDGIAGKDKDGKLTLELEPVEFVDKEFAGVVPVNGTVIYYDPDIIRMTKNRRTDLLAMFLSKRYRREYMIPFRDEPPVEWGAYECLEDMGHENRKGQKGRFDVREGMAFVMDDMEELSPEGAKRGAGGHPWLITMVDDDVVEVVMCKTLINNDSDKHRMHQLDFDNVTDIRDGCPPLDGSRKMTNAVCLDTVFTLPKKELFTHRLRLLNENTLDRNFSTEGHSALCMSEKELNIVRSEINEYIGRHYDPDMQDPFGFEAAEDNLYRLQSGEPVPDGFTNESFTRAFGWKHLPKADPNAVYPAESKMHPYEKRDVKIVKIVALRDSRYSDCKRIMREKAEDIKLDLNDIADISSGNRKQTDDMNNVNNKGGTVCTR